MGAKTWMLVYSDSDPKEILLSKPALDRERTVAFAKKLFPKDRLQAIEDGSLSFTCPRDNELVVGCFPGLSVAACEEFAIDYPSALDKRFIEAAPYQRTYLHAMHSVVEWFAFAVWQGGEIQRSLSLSPDSGLLEDIGTRMPFEEPYWAGLHPVLDGDEEAEGYPFVFHPLDLGEAALGDLFGYHLEGYQTALDPEELPLMRFKRSKPWWRWT